MKERSGHVDEPRHARRWPRERLAAAVLGLLSDDEDVELRGHSDDCPTCRETLERFRTVMRTDLADNLGHIPSHILWDWETRGPGLTGLQRDLIVAHLKRCSECREILVCMGQDPESVRGDTTPVDLPESNPVKGRILPFLFRDSRTPFGALFLAAAGLLLAFYIWQLNHRTGEPIARLTPPAPDSLERRTPSAPREPPPQEPVPPPAETPRRPVQSPPAEAPLVAEVTLERATGPEGLLLEVPENVRGTEEIATLTVSPSTRSIDLKVAPCLVPAGAKLAVRLLDERRHVLARKQLELTAAIETLTLRLSTRAALRPGNYWLSMTVDGDTFPDERTFRIVQGSSR